MEKTTKEVKEKKYMEVDIYDTDGDGFIDVCTMALSLIDSETGDTLDVATIKKQLEKLETLIKSNDTTSEASEKLIKDLKTLQDKVENTERTLDSKIVSNKIEQTEQIEQVKNLIINIQNIINMKADKVHMHNEYANKTHTHSYNDLTDKPIINNNPKVNIIDNLDSTSTTSALSANQGKVLNETVNEIKESLHNGNIEEYDYETLKNLKSSLSLIPGKKYLLTDYRTKYQQPTTEIIKEMCTEQLILTAQSEERFEFIVKSLDSPYDVIWYDFDNSICEDNSTKRNGFILRRYDPITGNDAPQDWRTMTWARYLIDDNKYYLNGVLTNYTMWKGGNAELNRVYKAENTLFISKNTNIPKSSTDMSVFDVLWDMNLPFSTEEKSLAISNYISLKSGKIKEFYTFNEQCKNNSIEYNCDIELHNNIFIGASNNKLLNRCIGNTFGQSCDNNILGKLCINNTFHNNSQNNELKSSCKDNYLFFFNSSNEFNRGCNENVLVSSCSYNILRDKASFNIFKWHNWRNIIGINSCNNIFEVNCNNNHLKNDCTGNNFGSDCINNNIESNCKQNTFPDEFKFNLVRNLQNKNLIKCKSKLCNESTFTIEKDSSGSYMYWNIDKSGKINVQEIY